MQGITKLKGKMTMKNKKPILTHLDFKETTKNAILKALAHLELEHYHRVEEYLADAATEVQQAQHLKEDDSD